MATPTKTTSRLAIAGLSMLLLIAGLPVLLSGLIVGDAGAIGGLDSNGIPPAAAAAYRRASSRAPSFNPPCQIPAWILAGVGHVESGHGTHGGATTDTAGNVRPPIIGPALPQLGPDTDDGAWGGNATVDHAVGPMQFIPTTWRAYGLDGNDDGLADPHNIFDAALTAAAYLCASASPMATEADWREGLLAYNHSTAYVEEVLIAAYGYQAADASTSVQIEGSTVVLVHVPGIGLTNASWAPQVGALLAAAAADGVPLTGSSYRDRAQQIALRRTHCGTSHYAIYQMPASQCRPPTARPGTSQHELGLAIDFSNCSRGTAGYRWLADNASRFGMYNLPSEPWHWSVNGS